jgi:CubicO group peptidase (beta-lactamase class C family)
VFRIGSVTKTFTAIAVLQLCEQGLVDLDAPAGDYLRGYRLVAAKSGHRPPTVRQLLTRTAPPRAAGSGRRVRSSCVPCGGTGLAAARYPGR